MVTHLSFLTRSTLPRCSTSGDPDSVEASVNAAMFHLPTIQRAHLNLSLQSGLFEAAALCFVFQRETTFWNHGWKLGAIGTRLEVEKLFRLDGLLMTASRLL